jgi:MoxR-like ATPase
MDTGIISDPKAVLDEVTSRISEVILGKHTPIRLALACLLARGHLLIEDLPGVGKTTLAHTLASTLGLQFSRIQFTSDLLPADILGISVYEQANGSFSFHPGPIFAQVVLADEINRATPKTQSALLEAMEELQVTVEGETRKLPDPFFVIATQNPTYQIGTFPLPESQLDRFLMRIHLGYPDTQAERALLAGQDRRRMLPNISPVLNPAQLAQLQNQVEKIHASSALLDYVQALLSYSRQANEFANGLSPRAGLGLLRAARAWAMLEGRDHILPDDLQIVLPSVVNHRLRSATDSDTAAAENLSRLLLEVPIP